MLFLRGGGATASAGALVRYFSKKRIPDIRRINPKVPRQEATAISNGLYQIFKEHGPLSVSNTWNHAKVIKLQPFSNPYVLFLLAFQLVTQVALEWEGGKRKDLR